MPTSDVIWSARLSARATRGNDGFDFEFTSCENRCRPDSDRKPKRVILTKTGARRKRVDRQSTADRGCPHTTLG